MNKKIIIGVLLILIVIFIMYLYSVTRPIEVHYPDEPKEWVERLDSETKLVNVNYVSQGQAYDNEQDIYLWINGTQSAIEYEGYYKGDYFSQYYTDNGAVVMRVNPEIKPGDGIIEGMIVERVINDTFQVFIFLDDDWKNQMPYTNIVWGKDYDLIKSFDFKEISPGIFMDQIEDDPRRFALNGRIAFSGIWVGDITQEEAKQGHIADITAIIFQ